jgi:hypothetical protein
MSVDVQVNPDGAGGSTVVNVGKNGKNGKNGGKNGKNGGKNGKKGGKNGKNGPGAIGVTLLLAPEKSESMTVLFNLTVNVYAVSFDNPVTVIGDSDPVF